MAYEIVGFLIPQEGGSLISSGGTISTLNSFSHQTKLIHDGGKWWYFYFKSGTANTLFYAYSYDLRSWTESSVAISPGSVQNEESLTVAFHAATNVVLVSHYTTSFQYMRGNISGTTITWSSIYSLNSGAMSTYYGAKWVIDTSGRVDFFATASNTATHLLRSTNTISTSFADTGAQWTDYPGIGLTGTVVKSQMFQTQDANTSYRGGIIVDDSTAPDQAAVRFIGTTWDYGTGPGSIVSGTSAYLSDITQVSDLSLYLLYPSAASTFSFKQTDASWLDSWANTKTAPSWPTNGIATGSQIALANDGTNIFAALITNDSNKTVLYNKYTTGSDSWGGWIAATSTAATRTNIAAIYRNGRLALTWAQTNGSNYDVYAIGVSP